MKKTVYILTVLLSLFLLRIASCSGDKDIFSSVKSSPVAKHLSQADYVDPFIGDWVGDFKSGSDQGVFVAQVIALGSGKYRINILEKFDAKVEPIHVLDASLESDSVIYTADNGTYRGKGILGKDTFSADYEGPENGTFQMKRSVRSSPTLGEKPPAGATVLFDGSGFENWGIVGTFAGQVNLAGLLGGSNRVAYLKSTIVSESEQIVGCEIGSDDGVKLWINGQLVHANNAARALNPGDDRLRTNLKKGENSILMKVTNGGGEWGACLRFTAAPAEGQRRRRRAAAGLSEMSPGLTTATDQFIREQANNGFVTLWEVSAPYFVEGLEADGLFDYEFPPEKGENVKWSFVDLNKQEKLVSWPIVDGAMQVAGGSLLSKQQFGDIKRLHLEFCTPFMPDARGQARGNSGIYIFGRYEVQVLDSYGLEGLDNECGGVYQVAAPLVNMCYPPGQWQTYDITFSAPRFDQAGVKTANARLTVIHNGVKIQDNIEIPQPTGSAIAYDEIDTGGIYLQDHGNPVQYRNIWVVE